MFKRKKLLSPKTIGTTMIVVIFFFTIVTNIALADQLDVLRQAIQGRSESIQQVDSEIKKLEANVSIKQEERKTLQEIVNDLANQQTSLSRKINIAEASISSLETIITEIDTEVERLEDEVKDKRLALKNNLVRIQLNDDQTLVEGLLKYDSLADFWKEADATQQLSASIGEAMVEMKKSREQLSTERTKQEQEKARILSLQQEVLIDKQSIDIARSEQDRLLGITKNEEASYQSLLAEKRQLRKSFEADLASFESQLSYAMNPATIPVANKENLSWPLTNYVITQNFGNTAFAASGAYNGSGHNGIDMGIPIGTPVMSARQGVVKGVGNTDAQCPNASYGKWILVEHDNGLSTLYAHLSSQSVSTGQSVARGQVIGYSGNTGYSTGPHLHFTVYASDGVRVGGLPSRSCPGTTISLPLADLSAYLNPRQFLP